MRRIKISYRFSLAIVILATAFLYGVPARASVNDFTISRYDMQLTLGMDSEKRSTLNTIETITANFPEIDQNHGIERYIPSNYDGHTTSLKIRSVKNQSGDAVNYTTYGSGAYTVLRIGDADRYVHGQQTYRIEYTQRDVTKKFADIHRDEFYWDTNGTEWRIPIENFSVRIVISPELRNALTSDIACYEGAIGSTEQCLLNKQADEYSTQATSLGLGDNISVAFGFKADTFAPYKKSFVEQLIALWILAMGVVSVAAVGICILLVSRYYLWAKRKKEIGTIVPEYVVPRDVSVQVASAVYGSQPSFSAQIIDFAVRHYIKIIETKQKSFFRSAKYSFEIIKSIEDLKEEEKEFLRDVFGNEISIGSTITTDQLKKSYSLATKLQDNPKKLQQLLHGSYGMQHKDTQKSAWFKKVGWITLAVAIITFNPFLFITAIIAFVLSYTLWPLTDTGLNLYRYLEGLKMYIGVAEADRLKMLQSPEGANKVPVDTSDTGTLVKLYEKLLPYAIIFGQEKQWSKQLGEYYETSGSQPDWYSGRSLAAFNAASFASSMNSLTSTISSSGAESASSGGSSGGGSSGGGGGGGGGGGW